MKETQTLGVIGAGVMGRGIAESAALAGISSVLVRARAGGDDGVARTRAEIAASLGKAVGRGKLTAEAAAEALARVTVTEDRDRLAPCPLVIESIVEDLASKRTLLDDVEPRLRADAVIGTNTSSLRVSDIGARLQHRGRLVGMHFFSPVPAMKLVELAPTRETAPFAVERAREVAQAMGKQVVLVGDTGGYVVNRLLVPLLCDAINALDARLASAADIDLAMQLGCGHPMGPLALADFIGLDVVYAMARSLYLEHRDRRFSPPALLRRLVQLGHLGKKTGSGIYDYSTRPPRENEALRLVPDDAAELSDGGMG